MKISLRPYQQEFIDAVRNEFAHGHKRVVGVAPCGAGKTIMTGWMIRESVKRGKRSIFFVHRKELIEQTAKTFLALDIPFGIINANAPMTPDLPVQIASVQTLARRIDKIPAPDFLICDECHHILANTYKTVLNAFPRAYLLGVTATPLRMGGVSLSDVFDAMVESLSVNQLIALGNLTKFEYIAPASNIDLSKVKTVCGDFDNDQLEKVMSDTVILGNIVDNYTVFAGDKSAICYCVNVNHSKTVADAFNKADISAAHCDGNTPAIERAKIVSDFRNGKIKVLCNAELFGEGFDVPCCQAVILARPTQSLTLYIQQAMRPLRPDPDDPDKVAVIIDHVQNYLRHGMPNDEREWSLDINKEKKKQCPDCGKWVVPVEKYVTEAGNKKVRRKFCPDCGHMFEKGEAPAHSGRCIVECDDFLGKIDVIFDGNPYAVAPDIKYRPSTIDELIVVAERNGWSYKWAGYKATEIAHQTGGAADTPKNYRYIALKCGFKEGWAYYRWQELHGEKNDAKTLQNARFAC